MARALPSYFFLSFEGERDRWVRQLRFSAGETLRETLRPALGQRFQSGCTRTRAQGARTPPPSGVLGCGDQAITLCVLCVLCVCACAFSLLSFACCLLCAVCCVVSCVCVF